MLKDYRKILLKGILVIISGLPNFSLADDLNMAGRKIVNMAGGSNDMDAVNLQQTKYLSQKAAEDAVSEVKKNSVQYMDASKDNIQLGGQNGTQIHNLSNGTQDMDAANTKQVNQAEANANSYTDNQMSNAVKYTGADHNIIKLDGSNGEGTIISGVNTSVNSSDDSAANVGYVNQAQSNANHYTDGQISAIDQKSQNYANTAQSNANHYTDGQVSAIDQKSQNYANTAQTNANGYTNSQISTLDQKSQHYTNIAQANANSYTDNQASAIDQKSLNYANTAETNANTYTNGQVSAVDKKAQNYANTAETNANTYTNGQVSAVDKKAQNYANTAETNANHYTDGQVSAVDKKAQNYANTAQNNAESYTKNTAAQYDHGGTDKANLTLSGQNGTQIHNMAPGTAYSDGANVGQVNSMGQQTLRSANAYSNQVGQQTLQSANGYTDMRINQTYENFNHQMRKMKRNMNGGIAGAMAMANLPQASIGHKAVAMSIGEYGGQESFAAGGSWSLKNGVMLRAAGTVSTRGRGGFGAGMGYQW